MPGDQRVDDLGGVALDHQAPDAKAVQRRQHRKGAADQAAEHRAQRERLVPEFPKVLRHVAGAERSDRNHESQRRNDRSAFWSPERVGDRLLQNQPAQGEYGCEAQIAPEDRVRQLGRHFRRAIEAADEAARGDDLAHLRVNESHDEEAEVGCRQQPRHDDEDDEIKSLIAAEAKERPKHRRRGPTRQSGRLCHVLLPSPWRRARQDHSA